MTLYERYDVIASVVDGLFSDESDTLPVAISQSFTVGTTSTNNAHVLNSVKIYIKKVGTPASDLTIEIREWDSTNSKPSSTVLASETVLKTAVGTSYAWVECGEFSNITLQKSTTYCLVVRGGVCTGANDYSWGCKTSDVYSGGAYNSSTDDGASFGALLSTQDQLFQVYGSYWTSNVVTYPQLMAKIGAGANATAKGIDYANEFTEIAEGYVNALTRYDWGENWGTLDSKSKKIVTQAVCCLAAIDVIQYDYTDYSSRFEAREKCAQLAMLADKAIMALSDQNVQTYIQAG